MENIEVFLQKFLECEVDLLKKYRLPNLEEYNLAVDKIAEFTTDEMKYAFGAKRRKLRSADLYERDKSFPEPIPRYLFRIDKYLSEKGLILYFCYTSKFPPKPDKKKYYTLLIIEQLDNNLYIIASFAFCRNTSGKHVWTLVSESSREEFFIFNNEDNNYELKPNSFGTKLETLRLMEPISDEASMREYEKD